MNLNRVITLSAIAHLIFQPYAALALIVVDKKWGTSALMMALVALLAINIAWEWGLLTAARGNPRGLIAAALASVIPTLGGISDALIFCPSPCQGVWVPNTLSHWATFLSGLIALAAIGMYLKRSSKAEALK
ncbi:MAG: hypothetical protein FJZ87_05795 [Chloroflexi bacterium]|nr:hypothetical protein [Chloroflexota bacterium]